MEGAFRHSPARRGFLTKESRVKRVFVLATLIVCLLLVGVGQSNAQQAQGQCLIQSPSSGDQARDQVVIAGVAMHSDFRWYQLGYAPDPNPDGKWSFFWSSETEVPGGQLGVWDTSQLADGTYQLILEVHRNDGNNEHCFVRQIQVNNSAPTATYTALPLPTRADTPTPLPTLEATATVVVEQPPTATPRPTPTYSSVDNPTPTPQMTRFQLPIDPASVRTASCRGAQVTILVALVIALYFIFRGIVVQGIRKAWKSRDVKGFHTRRPREY
jgi:hypothetical protein